MTMPQMSLAAAIACAALTVAPTLAVAGPDTPRCREVDADFTSELAPVGCASPLGLCATGQIVHDPLLKGPMAITISDGAPSAGMPASEPPSLLSVSGTRTLTPARGGTLTARAVGVLDSATFEFTELNVITGGSGRLTGATGTLYVNGRATSPTTFAGRITGTICTP
jgi:hypothetical protein